jgi:WD40 repeat protein
MPTIKRSQGLKLRHTLIGHKKAIYGLAWSPDGKRLASAGSRDNSLRVWDARTGEMRKAFTGTGGRVFSIAWSPDGNAIATASENQTVQVWDLVRGKRDVETMRHRDWVLAVAWSPDQRMLASGGRDGGVYLWNAKNGAPLGLIAIHADVNSVAWSRKGTLAIGAGDNTITLCEPKTQSVIHVLGEQTRSGIYGSGVMCIAWSPDGNVIAAGSHTVVSLWTAEGQPIFILEGHFGQVVSVSFSTDGRLLASKSVDGTIRLWRCDTWVQVAVIHEPMSGQWSRGLAFNPKTQTLATLGSRSQVIRLWNLTLDVLLDIPLSSALVRYANAKIVLVGDSGVGKSGLGLVLSGQPFAPTESTHGRRVWTLESKEFQLDSGIREMRETLLWDLAGQPGYRLIHQLHLNEVAVALVVFDARSETDLLAGVRHWDRALRQAQLVQTGTAVKMKKFLIAARSDRGAVGISPARSQLLMQELGFDEYFETSAREGWNVDQLAKAIRKTIDWGNLPRVSSTDLFQSMKDFLIKEKKAGRLLSTVDDLYLAFLKSEGAPTETNELRQQFETCIGRLESRDLIQKLSFGNLVLLQPEMLDAYASAIVNAAKDEPDGLGSIMEESVQAGRFRMSEDERIRNKENEKLLLIATVEDLLRYEIALREQTNQGPLLVFPSQLTRENPDLPEPEGKAVIFIFEGPLLNIYATLAVRLSHSSLFKKKEMWKNAATYSALVGGTCGIFLRVIEEARGELTLFFDTQATEETKYQFEEFVHVHLQRRAIPENIHRRRMFVCPACETPVTELQAKRRRERGHDWIGCNVCDKRVSLLDREERLTADRFSVVSEMDRSADIKRTREAAGSTLQGKIEIGDFDVFLCHNVRDKLDVKRIGNLLKERGILPWLDEWELPPGQPWQQLLEKQIEQIKSAAVFVGNESVGPWQRQELDAFLREFADRGAPVIPVVLANAPKKPPLPIFLKGMTWVDFRVDDPDPLEQLVWGITGKRGVLQ